MPKLEIIYKPINDVILYANNARTHNQGQIDQIKASIAEFGMNTPIGLHKGVIVYGHGRIEALKQLSESEVPTVDLSHLSDAQKKAYVIADNKLALNASWNEDLLALEIEGLKDLDFDIDLLGFDDDELNDLLNLNDPAGLTDEDDVPEVPDVPISKLGDIWLLGNHKVMCGDSTSANDVALLMDGEKAQLLHADPPYGMGKEGDGVANDNLYREKLDAFQMDWWKAFRLSIEDNGSAYIWGNSEDLWRLWYLGGLSSSERLTMRNEIVWNKKHGQGMSSEQHRMFPNATERCLFFMLGEQGFNNNADNYWPGFDPIRKYLKQQRDLIGWNNKKVADFFGFHPRMADHWFSESQWSFPREEQYKKLQEEAGYNAFKREYDELKREFYKTRSYFENSHDNMVDVWEFSRVQGEERHGHATPKPVEMMERVMKSSLPKDGLCIEPFGGSGSTLISAEKTNRKCYTMELQSQYVDVIIKRWQDYTGKKAIHAETGKEFNYIGD